MTEKTYTSEAGHWYTRAGQPCYTVTGKNGKERNTTLRDARTKDLVPSVTTVMKVAAAPGLERWKQQQVLLAAMTLPRKDGETEDDYLDRIMEDSRETGKKAAEEGTRIHAAIQMAFEGKSYGDEYAAYVDAYTAAVTKHFGKHEWICEKSFSHPLGYGGKCDMYAVSIEGNYGVIIDIKTKEFGPDDDVQGFDEHMMQLAAYRMGLLMPKARCANVFVSRNNPGVVKVVEWAAEDLEKGWKMFTRLLDFWQIKNDHR